MGVALYLLHDSLDSLARLLVGDSFQHLDLWNTLTQSDPLNKNWSWNPVLRVRLFLPDVSIFFSKQVGTFAFVALLLLMFVPCVCWSNGQVCQLCHTLMRESLVALQTDASVNRTATTYRLDGR